MRTNDKPQRSENLWALIFDKNKEITVKLKKAISNGSGFFITEQMFVL